MLIAEVGLDEDTPMQVIFGKNTTLKSPRLAEDIESNEYTLFNAIDAAQKARGQLLKRDDINSVQIAELEMKIAETADDIINLHNSRNIVVIMIGDEYDQLFGPIVEGKPVVGYLPGALLKHNGIKTFSNFRRAYYLATEINRQGQSVATLALFKLTRIGQKSYPA